MPQEQDGCVLDAATTTDQDGRRQHACTNGLRTMEAMCLSARDLTYDEEGQRSEGD